jgi:hypothetical protein
VLCGGRAKAARRVVKVFGGPARAHLISSTPRLWTGACFSSRPRPRCANSNRCTPRPMVALGKNTESRPWPDAQGSTVCFHLGFQHLAAAPSQDGSDVMAWRVPLAAAERIPALGAAHKPSPSLPLANGFVHIIFHHHRSYVVPSVAFFNLTIICRRGEASRAI